jgi:HTH-type transcriptional regulator/antitoxin HigA
MVDKLRPFMNIGTGEFIREELEIRNWQQSDLAEVLGLSKKFVNELIMSKKPITIETAKLLSQAFGQSPEYWINLDILYRLRESTESDKTREVEEKAKIFKYMPIKEMVKKGWIKPYKNLEELKKQVCSFWDKKSLDFSFMDKVELPGFKQLDIGFNYNKYYALCWYQMAKKKAKDFQASHYDKDRLNRLVEDFHHFMVGENGIETFVSKLEKSGIKFFVLGHLQKAFIDGASFFDRSNPVIVYASRHDSIDNFWVTMAHELSHIRLHLNSGNYFLDKLEIQETEQEREAGKFAAQMLKVQEILDYFKGRDYQGYISAPRITYCQEELNIDPALIVGILQHYGKISRKSLKRYTKTVTDLIPEKYFVEKNFQPKGRRKKSKYRSP